MTEVKKTKKRKKKIDPIKESLKILNDPSTTWKVKRILLKATKKFTADEIAEMVPAVDTQAKSVETKEPDWEKQLEKTTHDLHDFGTTEEKTRAIMSDPKPVRREEPKRDYATTEKHYILCVDEEMANKSLPVPPEYEARHELGGYLISDRKEIPAGWVRAPKKGTPIEALKKDYPAVYEKFKENGVDNF